MEDDLDDLFGDGDPLQISGPLTPTLVNRLNEASITGCCQGVAWSKSGIIATLTPDKRGVILQHLACDPQDGQWRLSKPYPVADTATVHGNVELVHLAWDNYTNLLALCDIQGRISVYMANTAHYFSMNRLVILRKCILDSKDDLSVVVGLTWLPPEQAKSGGYFVRPAVRKEGQWNYSVVPQTLHGPKSPPQRPTLLVVTRDGRMRMLAAEKDKWPESSIDLEAPGKSDGILTHAAFGCDNFHGSDSLLLATYSSTGTLRLYRVRIDVNQSSVAAQRLSCLQSLDSDTHNGEEKTDLSPSQSALTCLDFIPVKGDTKAPTLPRVLAVFTRISRDFQGSDIVDSTVRSWRLVADDGPIHSALTQLAPGKSAQKAPGASSRLRLLKSAEFAIPKALVLLQHISANSILAFGWNDGTVEFRDGQNLLGVPPDGPNQISGLNTIGFAFPGQNSCVQMALSPNANAIFCVDDNNLSDIAFLQYVGSAVTANPLDDAILAVLSEAFTIQLSLAVRAQNADDLMGTIQLFVNQCILQLQLGFMPTLTNAANFNRTLIAGFLRHLQLEKLFVDNPDQLSAQAPFRSCIAFHATLGFQGQISPRATESTIAMVLLNVRFISQAIFTAMKGQNNENELKRPDVALFFLPLSGWFLSLVCYLTDELLVTRNEFEKAGVSSDHIDANLINQQIQQLQTIVLPLLFGAASRSLLRHSCRALRALQVESDKHRNTSNLGPVFREFEIQNRRYPVSITQFERLLMQVEATIKSVYQSPNISEADKKAAELQVFIRGEIPPLFTQAISQLLFQQLTVLKEEINEANLYFLDFSDLALTNDIYTRKKNQEYPIDVITKMKLKKDSVVRRCTRCCSLTEDMVPTKGATFKSRLTKTCVCGSWWFQLDAEDRSLL